ncbi:hypothetical protein A9498_31295 (plasmid) [Bacillus thuringiensis serovar coreanensis]|nr:hypothetical protein A9498_31295 [Bacillus thuringiensis serovar coreanensis]
MNVVLHLDDEQLLVDIHNHIYVDFEYIHSKIYTGYQKRSVLNRLGKLTKANYLKCEYLPRASVRYQTRKSGRPQRVYTLASQGVDLVRGLRGEVHWKSKWSQRSASFVYHSVMLAHIECAMTLASQKDEKFELKAWMNEPRGTFQYAKGKNRVIRPDGTAIIGLKNELDKNMCVFIEMERSYGSKEVLQKKILRYNDFMQREEKRADYRMHIGMAYELPLWRLVFVAGSESREKELIRYLKDVSSPDIPVGSVAKFSKRN